MKVLNSKIVDLLDKIYNLRGKDSVVLVSMEEEKESTQKIKEDASRQKDELEKKIEELTVKEETLLSEGGHLKNALTLMSDQSFKNVLETLHIEFDPVSLKNRVESDLPLTINQIVSDIKSSSFELEREEDRLNEADVKLQELEIRKEEAINDQQRLNSYFDLAFASNINVTRDEITSLFAKFDFSEEEQREAAKLLMFPEDGLFDYEKEYKDVPKEERKFEDEKEIHVENVTEEKEEPIIENQEEITPIEENQDNIIVNDDSIKIEKEEVVNEEIKEETIAPIVETTEIKEEVTTPGIVEEEPEKNGPSKGDLIALLQNLGFDYLDFTNNDFEVLLSNMDEEVFKNNVELVKSINVNIDIFIDNVELLYDAELASKVEKLRSVGKLPQDIYLNPNVLTKYNLEELDSAIKVLQDSGLEPKNVPLMAY